MTTLRSKLEQWALKQIFKTLLDSKGLEIVYDRTNTDLHSASDKIRLIPPTLYRTLQILLRPDVALGQTYVDNHWRVQPDKLYDFLHLIRSQDESCLQNWFLISHQFHLFRDLFKQKFFPILSTRAVAEHYNTNVDFISLVLGHSLSYTCAFFEPSDSSLEIAQQRKLTTIAERIVVKDAKTVLDLGSGWGYAAFPLAENYGCEVTGITISEAQIQFCNNKKLASVAQDRIQFINIDYADYNPQFKFDRVISIGMLEHVGKYQYKFFFDKIAEFIHADGAALVHSMVTEEESSTDGWIDKYIFPGGYIPTISEVVSGIEQSQCELVQLFTYEKHNYFQTLELWKRNLFRHRDQCMEVFRKQSLKETDIETVIRIWEYFLSSSQIAFSPEFGACRIAHFLVRRAR
jgi:cyclopropane-fatty-acyl-phospholipid synthase